MPVADDRFRLGVNYWPAQTAMEWLPQYDGAVVRADFHRIAATGMDTIRTFIRWDDVQPSASRLDATALAHIVDSADAAVDAGVELIVTLFTGHMSGVNWIPAWATDGHDGDPRFRVISAGGVQHGAQTLRNWYGDADIVDAHAARAAGVSAALSGHPGVWAWDLGNENSNCTVPPDAAAADRWLDRMTSAIRDADPGRLITIGTHMEDLETDRVIGPAEAARWCDFVCMHGYPTYAAWSSGPTDPHLVPYLAELTAWLAGDAPLLFAEFGQPTAPLGAAPGGMLVSEADAADFTGRTLDALWNAGTIGALLWCYADYASARHQQPPLDLAKHERTFGLWHADASPKPAVTEVAARQGRPRRQPPSARPWLDITTDEFLTDRATQMVRLYGRYVRQAAIE